MGILNVDIRHVSNLSSKIETLKKQVTSLQRQTEEKRFKPWLDAQDVCLMLNISTRTLQNYRDKGMLAYSLIGGKCYYRPTDIELLILNNHR